MFNGNSPEVKPSMSAKTANVARLETSFLITKYCCERHEKVLLDY